MDYIRDYDQDRELIKQFFRDVTYIDDEDGQVVSKYRDELTKVANREQVRLVVDLADLEKFNHDLANQVSGNTLRYTKIFLSALDELLPAYKTKEPAVKDIMDVFIEQRQFIAERNRRAQGPNQPSANPMARPQNTNGRNVATFEGEYPPDLNRRVEVNFKPSSFKAIPIRKVQAEHVGKFVTVRGIVTRASDVKPQVSIVCYTCDQCSHEVFQQVDDPEFTPLFECTSSSCKANKVAGRLTMHTRGSKFIKFQDIKLQEHSDQVPTGHIPRAMTVQAHGDMTRLCAPGDHISVSGVFLTVEKSSFRARTGGLSADTYIEAHYITQMNKTEDDELNVEPMSTQEAVDFIGSGANFLSRLSRSIAPEIYGHEDLKKALLLLLVGGVDRSPHGMKIRGNINICLMGDPGVAKSQLLSFIDRLATRSQYTTGRGSSGVGLTAAVLKDPITNELALEGGALVLADQGICCIDEFDKMMEADRTAIHEVMEQQTVSIAKAGIMTTLNARVSILAAANPAYGRYNMARSITDNLQLPPALLSRFDLLWLIRDKPNQERDLNLAEHITSLHGGNPNEPAAPDVDAIEMQVMRRYINLCKRKNPVIPKELDDKLVKIYLCIRAGRRTGGDQEKEALFTSPRSLLAIVRLSTAFARLRLADEVVEADIEAAFDLYNKSRESIEGAMGTKSTLSQEVIRLLESLCDPNHRNFSLEEFLERSKVLGVSEDEVLDALKKLEEIESIDIRGDDITLIDSRIVTRLPLPQAKGAGPAATEAARAQCGEEMFLLSPFELNLLEISSNLNIQPFGRINYQYKMDKGGGNNKWFNDITVPVITSYIDRMVGCGDRTQRQFLGKQGKSNRVTEDKQSPKNNKQFKTNNQSAKSSVPSPLDLIDDQSWIEERKRRFPKVGESSVAITTIDRKPRLSVDVESSKIGSVSSSSSGGFAKTNTTKLTLFQKLMAMDQ